MLQLHVVLHTAGYYVLQSTVETVLVASAVADRQREKPDREI